MIHRYYEPEPKRLTFRGRIFDIIISYQYFRYQSKYAEKKLTVKEDLKWLKSMPETFCRMETE